MNCDKHTALAEAKRQMGELSTRLVALEKVNVFDFIVLVYWLNLILVIKNNHRSTYDWQPSARCVSRNSVACRLSSFLVRRSTISFHSSLLIIIIDRQCCYRSWLICERALTRRAVGLPMLALNRYIKSFRDSECWFVICDMWFRAVRARRGCPMLVLPR